MLRPYFLLCALSVSSLLVGCASDNWHSETIENAATADVFDLAYYTVRDEFAIATSDRENGRIESEWSYDAFAAETRLPARERVVVEVEPIDIGVDLRVRVERQVRDFRFGYSSYDDEAVDEWDPAEDNRARAAIVFQKIRSRLRAASPSATILDPNAPRYSPGLSPTFE